MRYKTFTDDNDTVVVVSSYAGKPVRGIAKCYVDDEFDYDKLMELYQNAWNNVWDWIKKYGHTLYD